MYPNTYQINVSNVHGFQFYQFCADLYVPSETIVDYFANSIHTPLGLNTRYEVYVNARFLDITHSLAFAISTVKSVHESYQCTHEKLQKLRILEDEIEELERLKKTDECPICYETTELIEYAPNSSCKHYYCSNCLPNLNRCAFRCN